jgi:iron complex transport system substrate-binding protein
MANQYFSGRRGRVAASLAAASLLTLMSLAHAFEGKDARRIVAIGGSVTEIIYALGEQDRLIARDTTSNFPAEANSLPDVGYIRALSPEGVLSVNPDLIVALNGSGPKEAFDALKAATVPIAEINDSFNADGVSAKIRQVGIAIGAEEKAEKLALQVDREMKAAAEFSASGIRHKVIFVLSMQGGKVMAAGANNAADGIIKLAGAANAMTDFAGYKQVTDEAIIAAQPDAIVMMNRDGDHAAADAELKAHPAFRDSPAARNGAVFRFDGNYLLGFGPRTASAVKELSEALSKVPASGS